MGKIRIVELSAEGRQELEQEYRQSDNHGIRQRCKLVLLKSEGRSSREVGGILGLHLVSVNFWVKRYDQQGLAGLSIKAGRGRKAILDLSRDGEAVRQAVVKERQRLKQAKVELEQELGRQMSTKTLKRFLKSLTAATNG